MHCRSAPSLRPTAILTASLSKRIDHRLRLELRGAIIIMVVVVVVVVVIHMI